MITTQSNSSELSSKSSSGSDHLSDPLLSNELGGTSPPKEKEARLISSLPGAKSAKTGLHVASSEATESKSKARKKDQAFQTMDGDRSLGFTFQDTDSAGERAVARSKLAKGEDGQGYGVHIGRGGEKSSSKEKELLDKTGVHNTKEYRSMLVKDFNFGALVGKYSGNGENMQARYKSGKKPFTDAVIKRFYPKAKADDPKVAIARSIAENIWSYASRGMDVNGGMSIAEMQGLLYIFDKQLKKSSDSNTKMAKGDKATDYFLVPGTEDWEQPIKLLKGDGRHGRATILTTRQLLANMTTEPRAPGGNSELMGADESYMLMDKSSSMKGDEYTRLATFIQKGGIQGDVGLAGFDADDSTLNKLKGGVPLSRKDARTALQDASADSASETNKPKVKELSGNSGKINNEQGMANALKWLKDLPTTSSKVRQLVIVTDEPDFNPGALKALQDRVRAMQDMSVKVLYSYNSASTKQPDPKYGGTADKYVIVDIMKIKDPSKFLVNRKDVTSKDAQGEFIKENTRQLDWGKAARAQGASSYDW